MTLDHSYFEQMEAKIPHGKVRTRFAPSPMGYMHVGNLRTAPVMAVCVVMSRAKSTIPQWETDE